MSTLTFIYSLGSQAEDKITGFKGTIIVRSEYLNGSVQYGLQPKMKDEKDTTVVPDAKTIDEKSIKGPKKVKDKITFKFSCGDKVKNTINDFEGVITKRTQWLNDCIEYRVEGKMIKSDLYGMTSLGNNYWEQELEKIKDKQPVKVKGKKRTGGPSESFCSMESV